MTLALPTLEAVRAEIARRAAFPVPQEGPQRAFVESDADITVGGGSAGGGKTFGLLIRVLRDVANPGFSAVVFRRETPQIRNPGGMWDESVDMYKPLGAASVEGPLEHTFPSGATVKFSHMERESDKAAWDGAQVPLICFDQLEHFTKTQFFYMLSRNRSACGVRPAIVATCNPLADSWLAEFLDWWIGKDGYADPERAGTTRWMVRDGDAIRWYGSREEAVAANWRADLADDHPDQPAPLSVRFVPSSVYDNRKLLEVNPQYLASLKGLQHVERMRLLGGNWKVRAAAGLMFKREWCEVVEPEVVPADVDWVRYWDRAATEKTETNDPDLTVGVKMGRSRRTGRLYLADAVWGWYSPGRGDEVIRNVATADGRSVRVGHPQDPGQAGKAQAQAFRRGMADAGFAPSTSRESGDKVTRFTPFSARCEHGDVAIVRGFDDEVLRRLESFPDGRYKDDADACAGAYAMLNDDVGAGIRSFYAQQAEAKNRGKETHNA